MLSETLLIIAIICLIVLTAGLVGLFIIAFKILMDLREIFHMIRHEAGFIAADVHEFRQKIKERGTSTAKIAGLLKASGVAYSILKFISSKKTRNKRRLIR